jgi:hypothetical protein
MKSAFYLGLILFLFSCKSETTQETSTNIVEPLLVEDEETLPVYTFPEVKNVNDSKSTVFSATLESDLSKM